MLFVIERLQPGPDTTVVTGPLTPDGRIDFPAALHLRLSEGITPENNAAVLIDRAFGAPDIPVELQTQYFQWLGIEPLPMQGDYFVSQMAFIREQLDGAANRGELNEALLNEFTRAQNRPWTDADCPNVGKWLELNASHIDLIVEATGRSRYYTPMITAEGMLAARSSVQSTREALRALQMRAMSRLAKDDVAGAWSDLFACHRLSHLVSQHPPDLIAFLVATALESAASAGDASLIAHGLSAEQARLCLNQHLQLPSIDSLAETIDVGQRLISVEAILSQMSGTSRLNLNVMLRQSNKMHDQVVAALKLADYSTRQTALDQIDAEVSARATRSRQPLRMIGKMVIGSRNAISESIGDSLMALLVPAHAMADQARVRVQIRRDLVRIGFALAAWKGEHEAYPQALDELVPQYLPAIPLDRFTTKPLVYQPRENGFLIYSIGANGIDDGGQYSNDRKFDDVAFEVPPKTVN